MIIKPLHQQIILAINLSPELRIMIGGRTT